MKTQCHSAFLLVALQLLTSCGGSFTVTQYGPPPPAPDLGTPYIIPIEWISTQSRVIDDGATRIATGQELVFRSQDELIYQIAALPPLRGFGSARLADGRTLTIAYTEYSTPTQASVFPNWPHVAEPYIKIPESGCVPEIEGYASFFQDARFNPAIGIWRSNDGSNSRVIIYASDYRCAERNIRDSRFSTLISGEVQWRLARVSSYVTTRSSETMHFSLLSAAERGEPIHYATYEILSDEWIGQ